MPKPLSVKAEYYWLALEKEIIDQKQAGPAVHSGIDA